MSHEKLVARLRHFFADGDPIAEEAADAIVELSGISEQLKAERDEALAALRLEETISFRRQMQAYAAQVDLLSLALQRIANEHRFNQTDLMPYQVHEIAHAALESIRENEL